MRTATDKISFAELGQKAQLVSEVLETTPLANINQVSTECLDHSDVMNKLVTAITNVTERICALEKIGKERCEDCGWYNHSSKDCRASAKTKAKFRNAQRRRSRSRGGSQDHSRDRYRGRSYDRKYDRRRSSSVGRTPYRRGSYSRERYPRYRSRERTQSRDRYRRNDYNDRRRSYSRGRRGQSEKYIDYPRSRGVSEDRRN